VPSQLPNDWRKLHTVPIVYIICLSRTVSYYLFILLVYILLAHSTFPVVHSVKVQAGHVRRLLNMGSLLYTNAGTSVACLVLSTSYSRKAVTTCDECGPRNPHPNER
jgi:uncharacterized membrane protein